ncbi:MAG: hypothetical protein ACUVWB_01210 [Anaerolineae bacterium]
MPVIRSLQIRIDPKEVLRRQARENPPPAILEATQWAIARAHELIEPALAYNALECRGVEGEELVLEGDIRIRLGKRADLVALARRVLVAITTIGPRLEQEVHALMSAGDSLKGYMLDCAGVVAVGQVQMHAREMAQQMADELGWGVGPGLYPGSPMGWPVQGQRDLIKLVPADEIGVTITPSAMLVPQKSSSVLIPLSPEYSEKTVGTLCHLCALKDSCWRRRERIYSAA